MRETGRTRDEVIRDCVRSTHLAVRRRHPDLPPSTIVVAVTDKPGSDVVKWTLHHGDYRPSVFDIPYTNHYGAAEYLRWESEAAP
jgi:hypothetical protein